VARLCLPAGQDAQPVKKNSYAHVDEGSDSSSRFGMMRCCAFGDARLSEREAPPDVGTGLLTQIERVLDVNDLQIVSIEVVEAARDSLVMGQS
jgi:hypothetical protein